MSQFNLNIKNNILIEQNNEFINKKNEILKNNIKVIGQYFICPKCNLNIPALPFFSISAGPVGQSLEIMSLSSIRASISTVGKPSNFEL